MNNDALTWHQVKKGAVQMWVDSFTTADGKTWDVGRLLGFWSITSFNFLEIWSVVILRAPFDAMSFGTGLGAAMAGMGGLLLLKKSTEPQP